MRIDLWSFCLGGIAAGVWAGAIVAALAWRVKSIKIQWKARKHLGY